jgi:hypothetical protein
MSCGCVVGSFQKKKKNGVQNDKFIGFFWEFLEYPVTLSSRIPSKMAARTLTKISTKIKKKIWLDC